MFTHKVDDEIVLKLMEYQDSEEVFNLVDKSRTHLKEWMTWVDAVRSVEDIHAVTRKNLLAFADRKAVHFIILYNDQVAGAVNINAIDWSIKSAEIGYWLGSGFTGKGIMTRAVRSLLDYAFIKLDLHKVEIWAAEENTKSRSLPETLGFIHEGIRRDDERINGKFITMMIYGILKAEWRLKKETST